MYHLHDQRPPGAHFHVPYLHRRALPLLKLARSCAGCNSATLSGVRSGGVVAIIRLMVSGLPAGLPASDRL